MKVIGSIAGFFFLSMTTFAGTSLTSNCSSSDGAIKWEQGTQNEGIELRYSNFIEGSLNLELNQANISFSKTVVFSEELFKDQDITAVKKVTVAQAKVTASEKHPEILRSQFPNNKVEGEVICTTISVKHN